MEILRRNLTLKKITPSDVCFKRTKKVLDNKNDRIFEWNEKNKKTRCLQNLWILSGGPTMNTNTRNRSRFVDEDFVRMCLEVIFVVQKRKINKTKYR